MEPLLSAIGNYTTISKEDGDFLCSFFQRKVFRKNTLLLTEGHVAHEAYFVIKGALRQFFVNEEGAERTCNFAFEYEFVTDLESFSRQSRATTNIMALESTECMVISCKDVVKAIEQSPAVADFFRSLVENVATDNIRRIKSLLSFSPEKQFEELLISRPLILQRVPQRYIAQYIGVAPESLSRIRKRMLNGR